MSRFLAKTGGALALTATMVATAYAVPVTIEGRFNMTLGNVSARLNNIDWSPPINPPPNVVRTYGGFDVDTDPMSRDGVFSGAQFGTINAPPNASLIQDLSGVNTDANWVPVDTALMIANFIQLIEQPTWQFTLTRLFGGNAIAGTPFIFVPAGPISTIVAIAFEGMACDTGFSIVCDPLDSSYVTTHFSGTISTQFNRTPAQLVADLTGGGTLTNSWSGTVFVEQRVPEPASLALAGIALLGLFGASQLRRRG